MGKERQELCLVDLDATLEIRNQARVALSISLQVKRFG